MRLKSFEKAEYDGQPGPAVNICGVLVQVKPAHSQRVQDALATLPGVEVHLSDTRGQIVVTVEDTEESKAVGVIDQFREVEGVLSAALVYHNFEGGDLNAEIGQAEMGQ